MKKYLLILLLVLWTTPALSQDAGAPVPPSPETDIFDDAKLLQGYEEKYQNEPKDVIIAMIKDETLNPYQTSAAIKIFKEKYSQNTVSREKILVERDLIRWINRTNSPFVETQIMHTLCLMDRYKYFDAMVPALILKLDHYNDTVNRMAYESLNHITTTSRNNAREARIIFNTLRKVLFLSRNMLKKVKTPDERLSQKLNLLRWSIKVLGSQEIKRLPKEVIHLL